MLDLRHRIPCTVEKLLIISVSPKSLQIPYTVALKSYQAYLHSALTHILIWYVYYRLYSYKSRRRRECY